MINLINLRIKLMLKNKVLLLSTILIPFLFALLVGNIYKKTEDDTTIPIVIIDKDGSSISKNLLKRLENNEVLQIHSLELDNALKMLKDKELEGIYILKKGLENKILNGEYKRVVDSYNLQESKGAQVITDIIAGELMYDIVSVLSAEKVRDIIGNNEISMNESRNLIKKYSIDDYKNQVYKLPIMYNYQYPNKEREETIKVEIDSTIIIKRVVLGIMLLFIVLFLSYNIYNIIDEKNNALYSRFKVFGMTKLQYISANGISIFLMGILTGIIQILTLLSVIEHIDYIHIIKIMIVYISYIYSISMILLLLSSIFKNVEVLQGVISFLILIMGILGGCFISAEYFPLLLRYFAFILPTYWGIEGLSNIIYLQTSFKYVFVNVIILLLIGIVFYLLTVVYEKRITDH